MLNNKLLSNRVSNKLNCIQRIDYKKNAVPFTFTKRFDAQKKGSEPIAQIWGLYFKHQLYAILNLCTDCIIYLKNMIHLWKRILVKSCSCISCKWFVRYFNRRPLTMILLKGYVWKLHKTLSIGAYWITRMAILQKKSNSSCWKNSKRR